MKKVTAGRAEFVKKLMKAGFKYVEACQAYESLMSTLADAVSQGAHICLGNVGALVPVVVPPRQVRMGFIMQKGGKAAKITREYFLDSRVKYKFRLYRGFVQNHQLNWPAQ